MTHAVTSDVQKAAPSSGEFRRSWPTLIFSTIGAGVGLSALGYILGTLVVPLQTEFGWGRGEINLASLVSSLGLAAALPFVGRFLDRFGVKRVVMVSVPLFVIAMILLSTLTSSLATFLSFYAVAGILGAGTSAVTYSKAVVEEFDRRRGIALGIVAGGLGAAGLVLPPLMGVVIADSGWRAAYLVMALLAALPFVLVFFARLTPPSAVAAVDRSTLPGLTLRLAIRRREFWSLCVVFFLLGWALLTMIPHFVPLLIDSGVDPVQAAFLSSLVGAGTVIARPVIGWLFDRFYATYVAVPLFLAAALGCLLLLWAGPGAAPLTALLIGIGFGAEIDLMSYLSSRYFGPRAFGALYSLVYSVFMIGSAFGPVFAGFAFDGTGSYTIPLILAAVMMGIAAVILLTLPRFSRADVR
ncbi:MFS transporter [Microbacterium sp. cx-59]|uniref:MFS transporter n=1 Tax=Microbacterium sp. cx-59 TaxID=2891207 RepID=UPI001E332F1B|nr:MFS transporter [Microbacterium sp. cx-59]MCC4909203.1 MFS transporter [Microbacterium sp. cx-59]